MGQVMDGSIKSATFACISLAGVTAALTATPSSDLNTQVESYRDKQEGCVPGLLLATLASSAWGRQNRN